MLARTTYSLTSSGRSLGPSRCDSRHCFSMIGIYIDSAWSLSRPFCSVPWNSQRHIQYDRWAKTENPPCSVFWPTTRGSRQKGSLCFFVPVSPPVRFEGAKITFFLNGRFVTNFGRLAPSAALSCGFIFSRNFGDLELTGTKKGFPNV